MNDTLPQNTPSAVPSGLDPQIVTLARAIRQTESGGNFQSVGKSGEYGAYQFMPSTWSAASQKFLGTNVPLNQATPQQQNEVAYKQLVEWKQEHPDWNIGNFASAWNAGPGKPNAYMEGNVGTNSKGVSYDTPAYAHEVAQNYQQFKAQLGAQASDTTLPAVVPGQPESPSLGGFAHNVLTSGAGLLAGVGEAILHPIQTVQNIGGTAVGGLEKVAGQNTENTQKFDNLVNFFKDRYGSIDNLEKTLYNDPVGVAADISTLFGGAGLAAKGLKVAADASKLGEVGNVLGKTGSVLNKASDLTNPLTPVAKGIGALVKPAAEAATGELGKVTGFEPGTIEAIRANPEAFTPSQIANTTREVVGSQVEDALMSKIASKAETTSQYAPIRAASVEVPVSHNFLEDQLRNEVGVQVKDGKIVADSSSKIRTPAEISKLQHVFDTYKPDFQKGTLTPEKFLNLRDDLGQIAYNDLGKKSTAVARVTDNIRRNLNQEYRGTIPGLKELDERFSNQTEELKKLRKGLIDKNGNLTDNAFNLVANAGNKGNEARLARLEQLVPGITEKLKVLKAIEDIQKTMGTKAGTYTRSILETGGVVGGLASGQTGVIAAGIAAAIITKPENAVRLIRAAEAIDPKIVSAVLGRLARYATLSSDVNKATAPQGTELLNQLSPQETPQQSYSPSSEEKTVPNLPESQTQLSSQSLEDIAKAHNFDLEGARKAGYSDQEIQSYLTTLSQQ